MSQIQHLADLEITDVLKHFRSSNLGKCFFPRGIDFDQYHGSMSTHGRLTAFFIALRLSWVSTVTSPSPWINVAGILVFQFKPLRRARICILSCFSAESKNGGSSFALYEQVFRSIFRDMLASRAIQIMDPIFCDSLNSFSSQENYSISYAIDGAR